MPSIASVISVVTCSLTFATTLVAQAAPPGVDTASTRTEALFVAKDYTGAASAFEALTRSHPKQPRYSTRLGTSLQLAGRHEDAIIAYRRAIGIGGAPVAMYNLGTVFASRGEKDSAFHSLDRAVAAGFTNANAVKNDPDLTGIRDDRRFTALIERMTAAVRPCLTRKESRLFDFWIGEWDVRTPQGQPAGTSSVQLILDGCALYSLRSTPDLVRQFGETSSDGGKSWTTSFDLYYHRKT
jgi:tetratricopeptide (TPR) repeat protein